MRLLLDHPYIDANAEDIYGSTPLSYAVETGYVNITRVLLNTTGVNVNKKTTVSGMTALHMVMKHDETLAARCKLEPRKPDNKHLNMFIFTKHTIKLNLILVM